MKKLILIFAFALFAFAGYGQTYTSIFKVANDATVFGRPIPSGQVIVDIAAHAAYLTTATANASATLATATVVDLVPVSLSTDTISASVGYITLIYNTTFITNDISADSVHAVDVVADTSVGAVGYFTTIYNTTLATNDILLGDTIFIGSRLDSLYLANSGGEAYLAYGNISGTPPTQYFTNFQCAKNLGAINVSADTGINASYVDVFSNKIEMKADTGVRGGVLTLFPHKLWLYNAYVDIDSNLYVRDTLTADITYTNTIYNSLIATNKAVVNDTLVVGAITTVTYSDTLGFGDSILIATAVTAPTCWASVDTLGLITGTLGFAISATGAVQAISVTTTPTSLNNGLASNKVCLVQWGTSVYIKNNRWAHQRVSYELKIRN